MLQRTGSAGVSPAQGLNSSGAGISPAVSRDAAPRRRARPAGRPPGTATGLRRTRAVGAATTRFVWDGQKLILETDGDGTTQVQFTLNLGTYGDLISQRRSSTSRWYHFDALGSTDRLTGADGSATDTYIYKAFGPLAASTGSTTNPFRYVGKLGYYDQGTGPLYVRARWLRPGTGSWLSADRVEGQPRYRYAASCPIPSVDPSGLVVFDKDTCDRVADTKESTRTFEGWINWVMDEWIRGKLRGQIGLDLAGLFEEVVSGDKWTIFCERRDEEGDCKLSPGAGAVTNLNTSRISLCVDTFPFEALEKDGPERPRLSRSLIHEFVHAAVYGHKYHTGGHSEEYIDACASWSEEAAYSCAPGWFHGEFKDNREAIERYLRSSERIPYEICGECCGWLRRPLWYERPPDEPLMTCGEQCHCWCIQEPGWKKKGLNYKPRMEYARHHSPEPDCVWKTG